MLTWEEPCNRASLHRQPGRPPAQSPPCSTWTCGHSLQAADTVPGRLRYSRWGGATQPPHKCSCETSRRKTFRSTLCVQTAPWYGNHASDWPYRCPFIHKPKHAMKSTTRSTFHNPVVWRVQIKHKMAWLYVSNEQKIWRQVNMPVGPMKIRNSDCFLIRWIFNAWT